MDPFATRPTTHPRYLDEWQLPSRGVGYAYVFDDDIGTDLAIAEVQRCAGLLFCGGYAIHNFVTNASYLVILRFEQPALFIDLGNWFRLFLAPNAPQWRAYRF
jgi:hypothetical protein